MQCKSGQKKGKLVVISGPSGVGKSTICREIVSRREDICLSVSITTRPAGSSEVDGVDYWFVSEDEFRRRISEGMLLEYAQVFGNFYGTPKDKVEELLNAGKTVILEIDIQGGKQIKDVFSDTVMIFILPPSEKTLVERLNRRARDASEEKQKRLDGAGVEIAKAWRCYNHMVVNENLQQAVDECLKIIDGKNTEARGLKN